MLEDKLFEDFKQAMKAQDKLRTSILSFLRSQLKNAAIAKRKEKLDDSEVIDTLRKEVKRHEESIEQFKKGNRQELAEKEKQELEIIKGYLPASMSEEQLLSIVASVLEANPTATMKDMGRLMKDIMAVVAGRCDGAQVSAKVKEALTKRTSSAS
jgi:uncharacterized protein YqeY